MMNGSQAYNKYPNYMLGSGDYRDRDETDYNQLFHNIGTMGDMPKLFQSAGNQALNSEEHKGHFMTEES
jgi:hypothetical protein